MVTPTYKIEQLPPTVDFDTVPILRALAAANRSLAELKGRAAAIPNKGILIDTLALQEAKVSSEVENIVTTQDELFQAGLYPGGPGTAAAKEVARYRDALKLGFEHMHRTKGLIPNSVIQNDALIEMFRLLKNRQDGFRQTPGTALRNETSGDIVYVPPQNPDDIQHHMDDLERYLNSEQSTEEQSNHDQNNDDRLDPLIRMALIHHQFESIHPFPDGNGRIGRILNVLYLARTGLLDTPILYLSGYITQHKDNYYRLLQAVRTNGTESDRPNEAEAWEQWVLFMLEAVDETAKTTLRLVEAIRKQMADTKQRMRSDVPQLYSQDLLNNLFRHPYTRIDYVVNDLGVTRQTASKYLDTLAENGFVQKVQSGRNNYFVNTNLVALFSDT